MQEPKRRGFVRGLLRVTPGRLAGLAVLIGLGFVYLTYLTPTMRAARHRLAEADAKSEAAVEARLKPVAALFAKGRKGSKAFAEEALSWTGKWQYVKGLATGEESHKRYLAEAFGRHVFSPEELRDVMQEAVQAYLDDVEGYEAEMLVKLRADLADPARPTELLPAHLQGDEAFRREYRTLAQNIAGEVRADTGVAVAREVGSLVALEVATQAAIQAARAAAADLGVKSGVLSTGVGSSVLTLGVGMVVAIILDYVLDALFKLAGYDPAAKIEALVRESLDKTEAALLRDPGFFSSAKKGSLRQRLEELHQARSKQRREAVLKLVREGGVR